MILRWLVLALAATTMAGAHAAPPPVAVAATPPPAEQAAPALDADRAQVLAWTRELESAPLAGDAPAKRAWLLQWIRDVRGLNVHVCDLFGGFGDQDGNLATLLLQQYIFGSASYLIEHPKMDGRDTAVQLAGVDSALHAYVSVRARNPLRRLVRFDELVALRDKGELFDFVESAAAEKCSAR